MTSSLFLLDDSIEYDTPPDSADIIPGTLAVNISLDTLNGPLQYADQATIEDLHAVIKNTVETLVPGSTWTSEWGKIDAPFDTLYDLAVNDTPAGMSIGTLHQRVNQAVIARCGELLTAYAEIQSAHP
ncbi:hypothetical protein ACWEN6_14035 [Sphaerisporangium sp. NPDC004334]